MFVNRRKIMKNRLRGFIKSYSGRGLVALALSLFSVAVFAEATKSLGGVAGEITDSFANIGKLITGASYLAGLGFSVGAIMKFKAHKDNPTQITIGTPIALVFVAAALLFLPSILDVTGMTMFGEKGTTAGSTGMEYGGTTTTDS